MVKLITGYACFRLNRYSVYVIASEMKTHTVELLIVESDGSVRRLDPTKQLPRVDLSYPCKFGALSAVQRANVRSFFQSILEAKGAIEVPGARFVYADSSK